MDKISGRIRVLADSSNPNANGCFGLSGTELRLLFSASSLSSSKEQATSDVLIPPLESGGFVGFLFGSKPQQQTLSDQQIIQFLSQKVSNIQLTGPFEENTDVSLFKSVSQIRIVDGFVSHLINWHNPCEFVSVGLSNALQRPDGSDWPDSHLGISITETLLNSNPLKKPNDILSRVALPKNRLVRIAPTLLPILENVSLLDLSDNCFQEFPLELHLLANLEVLNLSANKLTSLMPASLSFSRPSMLSSFVDPANSETLQRPVGPFSSLKRLVLAKNTIEVIGDLMSSSNAPTPSPIFPQLVHLDLSENNILDVFEVKACCVLPLLQELVVSGNPISKISSHRMNIFTYFKSQALTLKIDGSLASSTENKEILTGLTIAATTSSASASAKRHLANTPHATALPHLSANTPSSPDARPTPTSSLLLGKKAAAGGGSAKKTPRRAIAVVEDVPPPPAATGSSSQDETVAATAAIASAFTSASSSPARLPPFNSLLPAESEDLVMESMDSERSGHTPSSSRAVSPLHPHHVLQLSPSVVSASIAPAGGVSASAVATGATTLAHRYPSKLAGAAAAAGGGSGTEAVSPAAWTNLGETVPQQADRSFSRYFDALQEFHGNTASTASSSSGSSSYGGVGGGGGIVGDDDLGVDTLSSADNSFLGGVDNMGGLGDVTTPRGLDGVEVSPILGIGGSGKRASGAGSSRLEKIEQSVAAATAAAQAAVGKGVRRSPSQVEDAAFLKRGIGAVGGGGASGSGLPKRGGVIGGQFAIESSPLSTSPLSNSGFAGAASFVKLSDLDSVSSASLAGNMTPLANTPNGGSLTRAQSQVVQVLVSGVGGAAAQLSNATNSSTLAAASTATSEWHKKMTQIHEQARREAHQQAEEQEKQAAAAAAVAAAASAAAASSSIDAKLHTAVSPGSFHELQSQQQNHLPPQKPLISLAGGGSGASVTSGSSGNKLDSIGPYRRVYEFDHVGGGNNRLEEESVRSRSVHVTYVERSSANGDFGKRDSGGSAVGGVLSRSFINNSVGVGGMATSFRSQQPQQQRRMESDGNSVMGESSGGGGAGGNGLVPQQLAPRLVLARPVASLNIHPRNRRPEESEIGSERGSVYSGFQPNRRGGRGTVAGSIFSGDSAGYSVFSGMTGVSRNSGMPLPSTSANRNGGGNGPLVFPRAPNIPFLSINNSLQLHLKFKVFANSQEKILSWLAGSVVPQAAPYIQGFAANASAASNEFFLSSLLPGSSSGPSATSQDSKVAATIARMQTVERASYILLTDKALYIFTPTFPMPYDPFSQGNSGPNASPGGGGGGGQQAASLSHLSNVIAQVRYDDPSRILKLARRIPLAHLARVDVGPNRQYFAIHFFAGNGDTAAAGVGAGKASSRRLSGIGVEGSLKSGGAVGGGSKSVKRRDSGAALNISQNPLPGIRSLVVLSRDRTATTKLLDSLVPILYETAGGGKFKVKGPDGKVRIINQDVEWSLVALRDTVLLRGGDSRSVLFNQVDVDGKIAWQNVLAERTASVSGGLGSVPEKKSWLSELLSTPISTGRPSAASPSSAREAIPPPRNPEIIKNSDCDSATSSNVVVNKVNFEFLKLYLLVGWVVPHKPSPPQSTKAKIPPSLAVTVNTASLIATSEYIYLTSERFDIWPPPLFPSSTHPAPHVNAPLLEHAASVAMNISTTVSVASNSSTATATSPPLPPDPFKGLSATQIPQYSPPLRVGRVRDMVRCERWKTWRWKLGPHVTQVEEAPLLEQKVAALIQNGAVGVVKVVEDEWPIGGAGTRVGSSVDNARRAGATSGWDWWIRVIFKDETAAELHSPVRGGAVGSEAAEGAVGASEFFWDLVFATLDAANEFLEFVKEVRGVKPVHETEEMAAATEFNDDYDGDGPIQHSEQRDDDQGMLHSPREEFEDVEFARDSRLFDKVSWDGVGLVIGDD